MNHKAQESSLNHCSVLLSITEVAFLVSAPFLETKSCLEPTHPQSSTSSALSSELPSATGAGCT